MPIAQKVNKNLNNVDFTILPSEMSVEENTDLVATWNVPMSDKVYRIEFEHGTTTGKRVLRVNGKVFWILFLNFSFEGNHSA